MTVARSIPADGKHWALAAEASDANLAKVFWAALALCTAAAIPAILSARGLVYDGGYYLLAIATHRQFELWEPARHTVQFLQQMFAVGGEAIGARDPWTLGILFSLATVGWPIVITALCWFALPRGAKSWIIGPLINLIFAIPATSFIGIGEGIIASCLLWLAFLLTSFRLTQPAGAFAALIAVGVCTVAHESAVICLSVIAVAAALQVRSTTGFSRIAAIAIAVLALAGAAYMLRWIVFPRSAIERIDFLQGVLGGFIGTRGAPNIPALASLFAAGAILIALLRPRLAAWAAAVAVSSFVGLLVLLWVAPGQMISPSRYFAARGLPVMTTTALMLVFVYLWRTGRTPSRCATRPVVVIIVALATAQMASQFALTRAWNRYVTALGTLVSTEEGAVPHAAAMVALDPGRARFRREMLEHWSVEPLSIILAPGGRVRAVVRPAPTQRWVPYNVSNGQNLPRGAGLDWSQFRFHP